MLFMKHRKRIPQSQKLPKPPADKLREICQLGPYPFDHDQMNYYQVSPPALWVGGREIGMN